MRAALALALLSGCAGIFGIHEPPDTGDASVDADAGADAPPGDPSLLIHLPLDELGPPGKCAADVTGNRHDGACIDPQPELASGPGESQSFRFGPKTGGIHIATAAELEERNHFTVALWLNQDKLQALTACPINFRLGTSSSDSWQLCIGPDGTTVAYVSDGASTSSVVFTSQPAAGTWSHVALVYAGGTMTVYLNGALAGEPTTGASIDYQSNGEILIGTDLDEGPSDLHFDGDVDDVRFYNRALPQTELQDLAAMP